jgi:hypothetical protein
MADIIVKKCIINENLFAFSSYLDVGSDYIYIYCDWRTLLHNILLRMPSYFLQNVQSPQKFTYTTNTTSINNII